MVDMAHTFRLGAETERAAIVAWLRSREGEVESEELETLIWSADAIERGDHLSRNGG